MPHSFDAFVLLISVLSETSILLRYSILILFFIFLRVYYNNGYFYLY